MTDTALINKKESHLVPESIGHFLIDHNLFSPDALFTDVPWLANPEVEKILPDSPSMTIRDCRFFRINEIGHDDKFPRREAMENILGALNDPSFNIVYLLSGKPDGVSIYLGIAKNYNQPSDNFNILDPYSQLLQIFESNFQGSRLKEIKKKEFNENILQPLQSVKRGCVITGIPSINGDKNGDDTDFQGVDRLINSMTGETWQLLVICEPATQEEIRDVKETVYEIYNDLHRHSKLTLQKSHATGISESQTESTTSSKSKNKGTNISNSKNESERSHSKSSSSGISETKGTSSSSQKGTSTNDSESGTIEIINKKFEETKKHIDEELLERLNIGHSKGMCKTALYALAPNKAVRSRLVRNMVSIFQGNKAQFSPLKFIPFPEEGQNDSEVTPIQTLGHFHPMRVPFDNDKSLPVFHGYPVTNGSVELSTFLTISELSLLVGLPISEVPGVAIREGVDFGLNPENTDSGISLGHIMHRGMVIKGSSLNIQKEMFNKHIFMAGVTGSGKTTTCQRLLIESQMPFLVIEPAKTEYRAMIGTVEDLEIYTLGNDRAAPFRFNPFELLPGESIITHIDMLKASFTAAFPMEAAMPYILEEAIYKAYQKYGWDTDGWTEPEDANAYSENPWEAGGFFWPTLSDLLISLKEVVESKGFDSRLESDYKASLISRLDNLVIGSKGQMLNCRQSIDFDKLIETNVILEMDDLKDPSDKSFMMGLILARLTECIKMKHKKDKDFKHLTLVEEAHRLLEKVPANENNNRKHAVGMFTDMLAEVRKYGEGLIIVDQIPNKLAPEVLKNTNTKIIHQLFAKDDRETVGDTMGMDDSQKDHLQHLRPGEVVVFSGNWSKPVCAKIGMKTDTTGEDELQREEDVVELGIQQRVNHQRVYYPELAGSDAGFANSQELNDYLRFRKKLGSLRNRLSDQFQKNKNTKAKIAGEIIWNFFNEYDFTPDKKVAIRRTAVFFLHSTGGNLTKDQNRYLTILEKLFSAVMARDEQAFNALLEGDDGQMILDVCKNL